MSSATTNYLGTNDVGQGSDWWELTNLSTNSAEVIDLAGYIFTDASGAPRVDLVQPGDPALMIRPGHSIVFVRIEGTTNYSQFTNWWGVLLDTDHVRFYGQHPGFNSKRGDGVRLYDPSGRLVDSVNFGRARTGITFTSDTNGEFGVYSSLGTCGAHWAATADDLGSPGFACGAVPLRFLAEPTNQTIRAGEKTVFWARAAGLPRPRYQWLHDGAPMEGKTSTSLVIPITLAEDAGKYEVEITNGVMSLRSSPAMLTVLITNTPPRVLSPLRDITTIAGMNPEFTVEASGYPVPSVQWLANGEPIPGETSLTLTIPNCTLDMSGTIFCVQLTNPFGSAEARAELTVIPRPNLQVTEAMCNALPGFNHEDWFELNNYGTSEVNLAGWKFWDQWDLDRAFEIREQVVMLPGESIVFVKRLTAAQFAAWWGADNLPPGLKIVTFDGFGFAENGAGLYLWPPGAQDVFRDVYGSWSWGINSLGVSLYLDTNECFFGCDSVLGERGAFQAVECPDIGSPGYVAAPALRLLSIRRDGLSITLQWRSVPGRRYRLLAKPNLAEMGWSELGTYNATNATVAATEELPGVSESRFYRVEEVEGG